jgi:hypothetical protein
MYQPLPQDSSQDANHLSLLAVFYYVMAGFMFLTSLAGLVYVGSGILFLVMPSLMTEGQGVQSQNEMPPEAVGIMAGGFMIALGVVFIAILAGIGVLQIVAANSLRSRQRWVFCLVVAGLNCMHAPLGTLLGVFTFVVLFRPSVKEMFQNPVIGGVSR